MYYLFLFFLSTWAVLLMIAYRGQQFLKGLDSLEERTNRSPLPKVSIVTAVRNAEADIESVLTKLLKAAPSCEVIAVNDRSTDKSQDILLKIKESYPSLKIVHVESLPVGWLGKVHALHQGAKEATGDFILFMDVDVEVNQKVIDSALNACEKYSLDHLGVLPDFYPGPYLLNVMTATTVLLFTLSARPWHGITKRPVESTKGIGAFNLVKRSAFLETHGFEWLKMEVADDVALAQLIAKNNGRSLLMKAGVHGPALHWYESFRAMVRGLEKNIVGGFTNYKLPLVFFMSFFSIMPFLMMLTSFYFYPVLGIEFLICLFIFTVMVKKYMKHSYAAIASFPLGVFLMGCILLRSSYICFKNGGIWWSGTFYSLKDLRAGVRVRLGL